MKKFLNGLNGFRKWSMVLIFIIISTTLLVLEYIPGTDWMSQMAIIMSAFMATNIGEHIVGAVKDWGESKKIKETIENAKDKLGL